MRKPEFLPLCSRSTSGSKRFSFSWMLARLRHHQD
jgi:hypothetical protein